MEIISTKSALIEKIRAERERLEKKFANLTPEEMVYPGSMGEWSAKDILAHLVDWEQRLITWYRAGLKGETLETPAPGMTWRDLPELNRLGYEYHRERTLEDVMADYHDSYKQVLNLVGGMTEAEIFTPMYYAWTGKDSLLPWIAANTYKHYIWARIQIKPLKIRQAIGK